MLSHSFDRLSRRSLLLGSSSCLLAAKSGAVRVACQTNAWSVDPKNLETLLGVLAKIKELGFEGFETGFANLQSYFERPDNAYDRLKKTGLRFFGIHVFLTRYDPQTGIAGWDLLQQVANGGKALGAERLIVSGASTIHPLALRAKADALNKIAKHCKNIRLGFAYHNHDVEFRDGGFQIDGLLRQTDPGVHFVLDAGHAMEAGANVAEFFSKNWQRIDGIHLRDARAGQEVSLGEGEYNYAPLAEQIQASSWRGWLVSEEERRNGEKPGEAAVRPAREAIRRVFGV